MYSVDDIEVAVAVVRTAGGQAGEIERQPYGLTASCRDDQGLPFFLGQLG
jgi:predicted enzyme related to lactoylglutathione lyase